MDAWVTTLLPIVTLVLGAVLTFAADQWRWARETKREDSLRFVSEKREAYLGFLATTQDVRRRLKRSREAAADLQGDAIKKILLDALHGVPDVGDRSTKVETEIQERLKAALEDAKQDVAVHGLLQEVYQGYVRLMEVSNSLLLFAPNEVLVHIDDIRAKIKGTTEEFAEATERFLLSAREELGLPSPYSEGGR